MGFPHCFFTLFLLLLSFYCLSTLTLTRSETVVDLRNDLPKTTQVQLTLRCDKFPSLTLKLGNHYNYTLKVNQDSECTAQWLPLFTTWDSYKADRDKGHQTVYWSIRKDGFYESWDGSKWKFVQRWYSD